MARMRRDSSDSYDGGLQKTSFSSRIEPTDTPSGLRRSPRKQTKDARYSRESQEAEDREACASKTSTDDSSQRRQIRLKPLFPRLQRCDLVLEPSLKSLSLTTKGTSERSHQKLARKPALSPTKRAASPPLDITRATLDDVVESQDEELDVEKTISCDSDADGDSSEDDLPSPSSFFRKPLMQTKPGFSDRVESLTSHLDGLSLLPQSKGALDPGASRSRPSSSSDKENDFQAILRFSPPRLHSPHRDKTSTRPVTPPPQSPTKGKLVSPRKRAPRIPTPPMRPSLDAFWTATAVNDWNDQYSPRKEWSPRKLHVTRKDSSTSPCSSPKKLSSPVKRTKAEIAAKKDWETRKHALATAFLSELDASITSNQIRDLAASTSGVQIIWSKTLNSTAGRANWRRESTRTRHADGTTSTAHKHHASIELAEKVIADETRLRNVIAHEFCHLANFMISGIKDQPHGKSFKAWGAKVTKAFGDRGVEVTTKHTFEIEYKYVWQCEKEECAAVFQRHSKSIDVKRHRCGSCKGVLVQVKPAPRGGGGVGGCGEVKGYAAFVKERYAEVKRGLGGKPTQKEVMEAVGRLYRAEKAADAIEKPMEGIIDDGAESSGRSSPFAGLAGVQENAPRSKLQAEHMDSMTAALEIVTIDD